MYNGISRSFVLGYLLGLAGMPLKTALGAALPPEGETDVPAMFLYNGMGPIPALPEGYDSCPYATITDLGDGAYDLHLSDNPFFARVNASGTFNLANFYKNTGILFYMFRLTAAGTWSAYNPDILGINRVIAFGRGKAWANYDMPEQDGTIYLHKSAPIPILGGKENPIAPSVFLAGLRFGILSRHSNALPELPDGVLISSDGYILTDCNGVYLIAAVDADPDDPDEPAVPEEPGEVATMYLYGTPSESGNIGLRVGDTVTYYDGAVLPKLLDLVHEEETFPFVAMTKDSSGTVPFVVHASQRELCVRDRTLSDGRVSTSIRIYHPRLLTRHSGIQGEDWRYYDNSLKEYIWGEWLYHAEPSYGEDPTSIMTIAVDGNPTSGKFIWTNHNILMEDDSVYRSASDPIPIYNGIVEYINGIPIYE